MAGSQAVVSGALRRPFKEQVAFFRQKLGNLVPTRRWDDLRRDEHDRGFMVAGAMQADLLADLAGAVERTLSEGKSLDSFRRDFDAIVARRGWTGWTGEGTAAGRAWRTRIIYTTNAATSYAAGRYAQLEEGGFDLWVYHHGNSLEPRAQHLAWDGLVLPKDHPFWQAHYPPNEWGCSCYVTGARSPRDAERQGGQPGKPLPPGTDRIDPNTGTPVGVGKGWDYAPGKTVASTVTALSQKLTAWPALLGASFWEKGVTTAGKQARQEAWKPFLETALSEHATPKGETFILGAITPDVLNAIKRVQPTIVPATAEIAIRDMDVAHMTRHNKSDRLSNDWLVDLPVHLAKPDAVLLDATLPDQPGLLYLFHASTGAKLVVKLGYQLKRGKLTNLVRTGKALDEQALASIKGLVKGGRYHLLKGSL